MKLKEFKTYRKDRGAVCIYSNHVYFLQHFNFLHFWTFSWVYIYIYIYIYQFSSVQFGCSIVSNSLRPHGRQHARPPCPLPTPGVHPNSCPLSRWCHPITSSSVVPFSSCLQSFPASGSFARSLFFASGGQSIGVSASAISTSNEHSGLISSRIDWFDLIAVQGTLKSFLQHHSLKASILRLSAFLMVQLGHDWSNLATLDSLQPHGL